MEKRSVACGLTGMFVLTAVLILILIVLTIQGVKAQQEVMQKPYTLKDMQNVKMFGSKEQEHRSIKEAQ